ncbi:hypothetical protein V5O48_007934 [Marasmius crinis-equi]|uniref:Uncharacterized protein n=1 Tax=Marasmius crinis-equi TaxID=585013 RepID=A0ABR3FFU5_9AGAR
MSDSDCGILSSHSKPSHDQTIEFCEGDETHGRDLRELRDSNGPSAPIDVTNDSTIQTNEPLLVIHVPDPILDGELTQDSEPVEDSDPSQTSEAVGSNELSNANTPIHASPTFMEPMKDIRWNSNIRLGDGIDGLTLRSTGSCPFSQVPSSLDPDPPPVAETSKASFNIFGYEEFMDAADSNDIAASLSLADMLDLRTKLAAQYKKDQKQAKAGNKSLAIYRVSGEMPSVSWPEFGISLNPRAQAMQPEMFRQQYGDYFVSGYRSEYSCSVAFIVESQSKFSSSSKSFNLASDINAMTQADFAAAISSTSTKKKAKKLDILEVLTTQRGCNAPPTLPLDSPEGLPAKIATFLEGAVKGAYGVKTTAHLRHYRKVIFTLSLDATSLPRDVKVMSDVLQTIDRINALDSELRSFVEKTPHLCGLRYEVDKTLDETMDSIRGISRRLTGANSQTEKKLTSSLASSHRLLLSFRSFLHDLDAKARLYHEIENTPGGNSPLRHSSSVEHNDDDQWGSGYSRPSGDPLQPYAVQTVSMNGFEGSLQAFAFRISSAPEGVPHTTPSTGSLPISISSYGGSSNGHNLSTDHHSPATLAHSAKPPSYSSQFNTTMRRGPPVRGSHLAPPEPMWRGSANSLPLPGRDRSSRFRDFRRSKTRNVIVRQRFSQEAPTDCYRVVKVQDKPDCSFLLVGGPEVYFIGWTLTCRKEGRTADKSYTPHPPEAKRGIRTKSFEVVLPRKRDWALELLFVPCSWLEDPMRSLSRWKREHTLPVVA